MATYREAPAITTSRRNAGPVDHATYLRLQERKKLVQVDTPTESSYSGGGTRIVFHTLWRTPTEGVHDMKITATEETIQLKRNTEPKPNEFLAPSDPTKKASKSVIQVFADQGKTQRVELEEGDSLTGTIDRLRIAAKSIGKGVRLALDGDRKTARSFRFELIVPVVRTKKVVAPETTS